MIHLHCVLNILVGLLKEDEAVLDLSSSEVVSRRNRRYERSWYVVAKMPCSPLDRSNKIPFSSFENFQYFAVVMAVIFMT